MAKQKKAAKIETFKRRGIFDRQRNQVVLVDVATLDRGVRVLPSMWTKVVRVIGEKDYQRLLRQARSTCR